MEQPFIIGIRFQKSGKVYHFNASHCSDIKQGDFVVVETARGRQLGEVIGIVTNGKHLDGNIKPIQRKANPRDLVLRQIWQCKEKEAAITCQKKAKEIGLADLKIIGAEFSYDGTRLTLMYNSDEGNEKPDLRNLRKSMNRFYPHAQVELHPMGPRDIAKYLGGLGACGLEERCCTAYLTDFNPISIKMAKEQGISLTPTEITGICGRLRCCLAYEYEQYIDARKLLPKKNKRVLTPDGEGKVIDVFPLKASVLVYLDTNVLHEFLAHEIQVFDESGIALPRISTQEIESDIEEAEVHPSGSLEYIVPMPEETHPQIVETDDHKKYQPNPQRHSQGKPNIDLPGYFHKANKPEQNQYKKNTRSTGSGRKHPAESQQNAKKNLNQHITENLPDRGKSQNTKRRNRGRPQHNS